MAYNTSKGKRDLGDIEFEGDPDTQIDFGNNSIKFKTDSKLRLSLTGSQIKTSHPLTCSIGFALLADNQFRMNINSIGALSSSTYVSASAFRGQAQRVTFPIKTITNVYTASVKDYTILADTSTRNITVLLPSATAASGKIYNVKKTDSLNTLTITSSAGSTIDSATSKSITTINQSVTLHSNGSYWFII